MAGLLHRTDRIEVRRLKPQPTRRGKDSVHLLEIDSQTPPFLVPTKLLREGKPRLIEVESEGRGRRGLDLRLFEFEFIMN